MAKCSPWSASVALAVLMLASGRQDAEALPIFAREFGVGCQKCHGPIPRLNDFGRTFAANGYRFPRAVDVAPPSALLPGVDASHPIEISPPERTALERAIANEPFRFASPGSTIPLATKINLQFGSVSGDGLPRAVVDEVEVISAGTIGPRLQYFGEQYIVDGGQRGLLREAWLSDRLTRREAPVQIALQGGQFTMPLPVDVETFRESAQHYLVWDQTVGANPFTFFDTKVGAMLSAGSPLRGTSGAVVALNGHDRQSDIATIGTDRMIALSHAAGPLALTVYDYEGRRPDGNVTDAFRRIGYGIVVFSGRWESDTVLQTGSDSTFLGTPTAVNSSGGFSQLRYAFTDRIFALTRIDTLHDPAEGMTRAGTFLIGYRPRPNLRLTLEDDLTYPRLDSGARQTRNDFVFQITAGY